MAFLSEPQIDPICVIRYIMIICGSESLSPMPHLSEPQIILMNNDDADDPYLRYPMHPDYLRFRKLVTDATFVRTADHLDENDDADEPYLGYPIHPDYLRFRHFTRALEP